MRTLRSGSVAQVVTLAPVALTLVILWAMMSRGTGAGAPAGPSTSILGGAAVLAVFMLTFTALSLNLLD